jgi:tetratricopeptide (TPR) repeat protein
MSTMARFGLHRGQPLAGFACVLAGLFFLGPAFGQETGTDTDYVAPREPSNDYLDAIDRIEAENGPYATELSDLYLGLGQSLLDNGEYEQARDAFHRGVMVMRVNSGPNSPEQTNHLFLIANIETILDKPRSADNVLDNVYFINSNYYGETNPAMLPVLERMYEWYLVARPPGSDDTDYTDYERTIELTEEMVELSEAANGMGHPATSVAYRRLGEAQFQTVRYMTSEDLYIAITGGTLGQEPSVTTHYDAGSKAFRKYLDSLAANESTTPLEYAEALAEMGDWYLTLGRSRRARIQYRQAYQVLAQSEEYAELADSYMGQPKPVHFLYPEPDFLEDAPAELEDLSLDISITVTRFGDVHYVEVLNAPEGISEVHLEEIKKEVRETPFRPAMKAGEVVTTKDFIWQYAISPQGRTS